MKRSTVLVIEADAALCRSITEFLESHGYQVSAYSDAPAALDYLQGQILPNIVLLGMNLPSMSGFAAAKHVKMAADLPIIFLMSRADRQYLVEGLKKYAEDFVIKPVNFHELESRIQIVLERLPMLDYGEEPVIRVDSQLSIDLAQNRAFIDGRAVRLTPTEAVLLHVLLRHAPRVVRNHALLARVWPTEEVYEDTLRVHMHRLRRKLEADSHHPRYIRTERGVGYRFTIRPTNWPDDES